MSNLNIYNIQQEFMLLAEELINNGGELTPEIEERLIINQGNLEHKARGYGYIIKDLENDNETIDKEIARLTTLKKSRSKTIDRMKETVKNTMELFNVSEIKSPTLKINFRRSETVEVDTLIIDAKWCNVKTTLTPDKKAIKEAILRGEEVVGATIETHQNLQIK